MHQTTMEAWLEWKDRCALAKCSKETKESLVLWGAPIFRNAVARYDRSHNLAHSPNESFVGLDPAWSWMEIRLIAGKKTEGKRYKDSLFLAAKNERTDEARRRRLESYFAVMAKREAYRLALRDRYEQNEQGHIKLAGIKVVSLQEPEHSGVDALTFEQLYAGADHEGLAPESEQQLKELDDEAQSAAREWFASMELREKLAWGGRFADRTLADPEICRLAGCNKTQLYASLRSSLSNLKESLMERYGAESDTRSLWLLFDRTSREVAGLCMPLLPPEKREPTDS